MGIPNKDGDGGTEGNRGQSRGLLDTHAKLAAGVTTDTLQQLFLNHRHSGQILDGQSVRALVLADTVNGHLYNITMQNGVLTPVKIR